MHFCSTSEIKVKKNELHSQHIVFLPKTVNMQRTKKSFVTSFHFLPLMHCNESTVSFFYQPTNQPLIWPYIQSEFNCCIFFVRSPSGWWWWRSFKKDSLKEWRGGKKGASFPFTMQCTNNNTCKVMQAFLIITHCVTPFIFKVGEMISLEAAKEVAHFVPLITWHVTIIILHFSFYGWRTVTHLL